MNITQEKEEKANKVVSTKQKAKVYIVTCSCCKNLIDSEEVLWFNGTPVCVHCIVDKKRKSGGIQCQ
jgi:hypothetical protein